MVECKQIFIPSEIIVCLFFLPLPSLLGALSSLLYFPITRVRLFFCSTPLYLGSMYVLVLIFFRSDKVLVGVVLWNDLAIALADYRRRGSSVIAISNSSSAPAPINSSRGTPPPPFASTTTMIDGRRYQAIGAGDSEAAAAAAAGGRFDWEESSEEGGEGDSGGGSWWPRLAEVGGAIGRRMGWFPMVRTAEASLLR